VKVAMLVMNDMRADARVDREAAALAAAGHSVTVVALRAPDAADVEARAGYHIRRVAEYGAAGWRRPLAKIGHGRERIRRFTAAAVALGPEVVHAHDSDTLAAAGAAVRSSGARFVYDAHELFPDMLQEHGLRGSPPIQWYWRRVERTWVPRADAVIAVSPGIAAELARRYHVYATVLANVPPLAEASPSRRLRRELGLGPSVPLVLYQGVLIPGRGLTRLVRAMATVPAAVLVVQGFGPEEAAMRTTAESAGLGERVRFMGRIEPAQLHEYACGADVGVVIYEHTTLNNYLAAPNKLYAYLMAGLPVAASDFPGLAGVVQKEGVGAVFDPASEAAIAAAVRGILGEPALLQAMRARARELAVTRYNWDVEQGGLLELYERLTARSTA
jgi:glycosyltransferase involved in cell wall biosynthesis